VRKSIAVPFPTLAALARAVSALPALKAVSALPALKAVSALPALKAVSALPALEASLGSCT
jgi:hypothetical protein